MRWMTDYVFGAERFHFHKFHLTKFNEMNFLRRIQYSVHTHTSTETERESVWANDEHLIICRCSHLLAYAHSFNGTTTTIILLWKQPKHFHARVVDYSFVAHKTILFRYTMGECRMRIHAPLALWKYPRIKLVVTSISINHVKRK